jgi:hypothetical protein
VCWGRGQLAVRRFASRTTLISTMSLSTGSKTHATEALLYIIVAKMCRRDGENYFQKFCVIDAVWPKGSPSLARLDIRREGCQERACVNNGIRYSRHLPDIL